MNITIIGHVCIDHNISEHAIYTASGGPATFMSQFYHAIAEIRLKIIAPYGADFLPHAKKNVLYPEAPCADWTLIYENKSQGNTRSQKAFNTEYAEPIPIDEDVINIISSSDVIFVAPITPQYQSGYIRQILTYAKKPSVKILLPQGYYRDFDKDNNVIQRTFFEADTLIPLFDFIIVSEQDHREMEKIVKKWSHKTQVIMTLGDRGSIYVFNNKTITVPVEIVDLENIVDSVGSGDIFSASFAYKYYLSEDIRQSLEFANGIARQSLFYPATDLKFVL